MIFHIENFGPITNADVEYGKLTVICGKNNTGKTYLTYTLYALLHIVKNEMSIKLSQKDMVTLIDNAYLEINLDDYVQQYIQAVQECKETLKQRLPTVFAKHPDKCKGFSIDISLSPDDVRHQIHSGNKRLSIIMQVSSNCKLTLTRKENSPNVVLAMQNTGENLPHVEAIRYSVQHHLVQAFNSGMEDQIFPRPFVITCERTGIAIFSHDIALAALDMSDSTDSSSSSSWYGTYSGAYMVRESVVEYNAHNDSGYQLPVNMDIRFVLDLGKVVNKKSYVAINAPGIIDNFEEISGGKYIFDKNINQVLFIPNGSNDRLSMHEASSTVRSLMELNFYLNHLATPQQMLIFDEPEQNLHPENQRKLARLLARLVKVGISVLVTTHSDYIIREFNTLIQLNNDDEFLKKLQINEGYSDEELLNADKVRAYVTENRKDGFILKEAPITQHDGMTIDSIDEVIDKMNQIHDAIIWGE